MKAGRMLRGLGAVAAGILVLGARASEGRAVLKYDFSLGAGAFYNDNLYFAPETDAAGRLPPVAETSFSVAPAFALDWTGQHDRLSCGYRGAYWSFTGDQELDPRWTNNLGANLSWRRWSPFFLEVNETLEYGELPEEVDIQAPIDYSYTNVVAVRTGLLRELGARGEVQLAYRGELETYPQVENADRVLSQYGEASVRYRWSPLWGSAFSVSYGHVERDLTADYDELTVTASADQRLSEHLELRYGLEWIRDTYDAAPAGDATAGGGGAGDYSSLLLSAEVKGDLERKGFWSLTYEDTLEYLSDGDSLERGHAAATLSLRSRKDSTLTLEGWHDAMAYRLSEREDKEWGATFSARWMITPKAACDLLGTWTNTTIQQEASAEIEDRTLEAGAGVVVMVLDHLQLEAGYLYRNNDSNDELRTYVSNRLYALLTYHFQPLRAGELPSSYLSRLDDAEQFERVSPWGD
jgi:hypothetical protein